MILEDYINSYSDKYYDKIAVIDQKGQLTYAQLWQRISSRSESWKMHIEKNSSVVLRAEQTADFLIDYFAIHLAGGVAVPLEKDIPESQIKQIQNTLKGIDIPHQAADILFTTGTTGQSKGVMISHDTILADAENLVEGLEFKHDTTFIINGPLNRKQHQWYFECNNQ